MDEVAKYAVGIDVGTENVRAVVASVNKDGAISVVGYNEGPNTGMRKGEVANLTGPAESIDRMLGEVERMSGYEVNSAYISINGSSILSTKAHGTIATSSLEHEINEDDLLRVEDAAVIGQVPANRKILDVLPLMYKLDDQAGIKDPLGMTGARLEVDANVISALAPNALNLQRATEGAKVIAQKTVPSVVAGAEAVLTDRQRENGVVVIDLGGATTGVAVYESGDLQYVSVIPMGSNNVTNDLAIMLEIDMETAEDIKRRFVSREMLGDDRAIVVHRGREELAFNRAEVSDIVAARLNEIFGAVRRELQRAGYDRKLPEGAVLIGGGAKMKDIMTYAKDVLEASIKIGVPTGLGGVADAIAKPEYAAAAGLAILSARGGGEAAPHGKKEKKKSGGLLKKIFKSF